MKVERLLQVSVALLAALGSMFLALGQGSSSTLPMLATLGAFLSIYVTDIKGWIKLNRNLANFAALIAVVFSFFDFWDPASSKLISIAKLLIYLQVVLLFQPKSTRVYWHLAVLSLLQVVVSAALDFGVMFGVLLIPYMIVASTTLCLFFVYRETLRVDADLRAAHDAVENRPVFTFSFTRRAETNESTQVSLPAISLSGQLPGNLAAVFTSGRMFIQVLKLGAFTLVCTVVLFYCLPRFQGGNFGPGFNGGGNTTTGFKDQITLHEMEKILKSDQFVMRVRLFNYREGGDPEKEQLIETEYEPFFRGTSLSTYFAESKTWIVGNLNRYRVSEIKPPRKNAKLARQVVATNQMLRFDNTNEGVMLFSMYPAYKSAETPDNFVDNQTLGILSMEADPQENARQPDQYELLVPWNPFGADDGLIPNRHKLNDRDYDRYLHEELVKIPSVNEWADNMLFRGLTKIANELAANVPLGGNEKVTPEKIARRMERHFQSDGHYTYALRIPAHLKKEELDPIEDFVVNHRTGHCEYFASALAIMLRTQNIPARIVVGYKGGEYNSVGKYYAVKQKHAHAWVECFLGPDELPAGVNPKEYPFGAWMRLDPTPASRPSPNRKETGTIADRFLDWFDYFELWWRDNVVGMTSERQEKEIYKPLTDNLIRPFEGWVSRDQWVKFFRETLASMGIHLSEEWSNGILTIFGLLVLLMIVVLVEFCRVLFLRCLPTIKYLFGKFFPDRSLRAGFYFKAENLLAKAGWRRKDSQTPHEFVQEVVSDCRERNIASDMLPALIELANWYYLVRFGGRTLAPEQEESIAQYLYKIEQQTVALQGTKRPAPAR
ncbi:DUF3488 domain-containing protein [bacterium]|nr:DUF3488 domain-containing protein [bacterium]